MSTVNPVPARPLNLSSINVGDIATIKNASEREKIGSLASRIWDKISDFFCGTDREQAKKYLFDLYSPATPDTQKIQCFFALQGLAGGGVQDRFQHSVENGKETYALLLDGDDKGEGLLLTRTAVGVDQQRIARVLASDRQDEDLQTQLKKDITRGDYLIGGQPLVQDNGLESKQSAQMRLAQFEQKLTALQCTPEESMTLRALANQATFAVVMQSTVPPDPAHAASWIAPLCPSSAGQSTEYHISREDGVLRLRARCAQDIATEPAAELLETKKEAIRETDHLFQALEITLDIAIDAQGQSSIQRLDYFVNKGSDSR